MKCPRCQQENPAGSSFCLRCGTGLGLVCGACGNELPPGSRFCNKCGAPVTDGATGQPRFASPESYSVRRLPGHLGPLPREAGGSGLKGPTSPDLARP